MTIDLKNQEIELWNRYKVGDKQALQLLLKSLEPVIQGQVNKFAGVGLPRVSIEMEAKRLTIQALDSYNPALAKVSTHVTNYLKKLQRFVMSYQNVGHIPEPRAIAIGKYQTIYENIESDKGREPTVEELADQMQWSPVEVNRLQTELRKDLSIKHDTDDDTAGGFYYYSNPFNQDQESENLWHFIYYDADPIDKKIMEYTLPIFGVQGEALNRKQVAAKLNLTVNEVKKRQQKLAEKMQGLI